MSNPLFQARYEVTYVEDLGGDPNLWRLTGTMHDSSGSGFAPADAAIGDLVFDEDTSLYFGFVNCWQVTEIVSAGPGLSLVVKVQYNETGSPAGAGEPVPGSNAICRVTTGNLELSQAPAQGWTQISETLSNAIRNYDGRTISVGGGGTGTALVKTYTQASHGFAVGDAVYLNGSTWTKAIATSAGAAETVGVVSAVDGDDFDVTFSGEVTDLADLVAGTVYFLSASVTGAITDVEPAAPNVSKPILIATAATAGVVVTYRGLIDQGIGMQGPQGPQAVWG